MITLKMIASTHIDRFSSGDRATDSELSYQQVVFNARSILNELLHVSYLEKWQEGDKSAITQCIASYELTLTNGPDCAQVTLPEFYINLPHNRGLHRIFQRAKKAKGFPTMTEFTLMHQPSVSMKTRTARYPGMNTAYIEGNIVKFLNIWAESPGTNPNTPGTNVIIAQLIVAAPDTIGENDALPIMPELIPKVYDRLAQMEMNPALKIQDLERTKQ